MPAPVTERGFFGRFAEGVRSAVRGYSPQQLVDARRILVEGVVTELDRVQFINEPFERFLEVGSFPPMYPFSNDDLHMMSSQALIKARRESDRLKSLRENNPDGFDQELQAQ